MATIYPVNREQAEILDILWNTESEEECKRFLKNLPDDKLLMAMTLMEMIVLADLDDSVDAMMPEVYPEAQKMLEEINISGFR
ncbi:MAG: hypothetical protein N0C84_00985 [Candidatus Thiodiazotropha taylori]|uniref:Uncharacterized protein n=1 Tax=Candidatus Thiodiazotropha taylori TaxID=2792791 RepID=A0A9E4KA61_9GAMM|nr:hypothetical protein [Candidatus Thiodiazotropha taylori]MCW4255020.1 hypothetical protein [Candidatus Thiodiazotropha taylori]